MAVAAAMGRENARMVEKKVGVYEEKKLGSEESEESGEGGRESWRVDGEEEESMKGCFDVLLIGVFSCHSVLLLLVRYCRREVRKGC